MLISEQSKTHVTNRWNDDLRTFPVDKKDIYFTEEYVKLYESGKDKAECFVYKENEKTYLFPYLKRRINITNRVAYDFETPYGYGGPICNVNDTNFCAKAFGVFQEACRENDITIGLIKFHPLLRNQSLVGESCETALNRKTVAINLSSSNDVLWDNHFSAANKRAIRKAEDSGVIFKIDKSLENFDSFQRLYRLTMDKVQADRFYYFEEDYFNKIKGLAENVFLASVSYGNRMIAGALFFKYGMYAHYHLGASLKEFLNCRPNNVLFYKTILHLKEAGYQWLHLGGGTTTDDNNSLYRFKRNFSKDLCDFYLGKFISDRKKYDEICQLWTEKYPEKQELYKHLILKHRF